MARNKQEDRLSALVRSTERDTWEKGQQAGRWLSQHMYSEKEKREMEKKRRAQQRKAQAQAAQPGAQPLWLWAYGTFALCWGCVWLAPTLLAWAKSFGWV